eukprot:690313-Pyramimonas_sp.AAC.1
MGPPTAPQGRVRMRPPQPAAPPPPHLLVGRPPHPVATSKFQGGPPLSCTQPAPSAAPPRPTSRPPEPRGEVQQADGVAPIRRPLAIHSDEDSRQLPESATATGSGRACSEASDDSVGSADCS